MDNPLETAADPVPNTAAPSILFAGDAFWGEQGAAHRVAHCLLLEHPERDYRFWHVVEPQLTLRTLWEESFRMIIGRNPAVVVLGLGWSDLSGRTPLDQMSTIVDQVLTELRAKIEARVLVHAPPPEFLPEPLQERARQWQAQLCERTLAQGHAWLDLQTPLAQWLELQSKREGTLYGLHHSDGTLSPMGQAFLAHQLLAHPFLK